MSVRIANHPIHPMLVPIPIGLFLFALVADIATHTGWADTAWPAVAYYCIGGGIIGGLLAAVFGFLDYISLTDLRAKRVATAHMLINLAVVGLFVVNFALRWNEQGTGGTTTFVLTIVAILLLVVSGWLGGELVYVRRVAVAPTDGEVGDRRHVDVPVRQERRHTRHHAGGTPLGEH
jgi:uncharacterized membrane protein